MLLLAAVFVASCGNDRTTQETVAPNENPTPPATQNQGFRQAEKIYDAPFLSELRAQASVADTRFRLAGDEMTGELLTVPSDIIPSESMAADGYGSGFKQLGIVWKGEDAETLILYIDEEGVHDLNGDVLLDQIEARHGYAWRLSQAQAMDEKPSRSVLVLVILDETGEAASDEVYVYWDGNADDGAFKATNLPEEWMER